MSKTAVADPTDGIAIASAAQALVGTPFRLHGRNPPHGLDCVGLVSASLDRAGFPSAAPSGYSLRNSDISAMLAFAERAGLREVGDARRAGDVLLTKPSAGQFHLLIRAGQDEFVHAHAGLRRIISAPGPQQDPVIRHWRFCRLLYFSSES